MTAREKSAGLATQTWTATTCAKWHKPAEGRYKCSVDASFPTQRNRTHIGICIRDIYSINSFLTATKWFALMCLVNVGEAYDLLV